MKALVQRDRAGEAAALVADMRPFFDTHPGLGTANVLDLAAAIAACWTDPARAHDGVALAYAAAIAAGLAPTAGEIRVLLAVASLACGDADAAVAVAEEALETAVALGNRETACAATLVSCAADRLAPAAPERAHGALADSATFGLRPLVPDGLDLVAGLFLDSHRPALAARLHAASDRLRVELGICPSPLARLFRPADNHRVAELLSAPELASAQAEGARLNLEQAVAYAARSRGRRLRPRAGWDSLTPTERDVVTLITQGLNNRAIGEQLLITAGTVKTHLRSVFGKLGVTSRTELAAHAARRNP